MKSSPFLEWGGGPPEGWWRGILLLSPEYPSTVLWPRGKKTRPARLLSLAPLPTQGVGRILAALAFTLATPAQAEVLSSGPDHFTIQHKQDVALPRAKLWAALINWDRWWSPKHSFSGRSPKLVPKAGGLLTEVWPDGSVLHGTVINIQSPKLLRIDGAFGPLQSMPVTAILNVQIEEVGPNSRVTLTYTVGGPASAKLDQIAKPVDAVWGEGVARLTRFALTGKPE
jgi:hypothetical protein